MKNNNNIVWHHAVITPIHRENRNGHKGIVLWFTGLSGAGKSTLAHYVEERLFKMGCHTFVFDGDNVRHGLCSDLGFSPEDRSENIRRIGEMVKLFTEAGIIALTAFISPFIVDRERVRALTGSERFIEIFCDSSIAVCESRDTKGLYAKARRGEIKGFTGISSPYEPPVNPELYLKTDVTSLEDCVDDVIKYLKDKKFITHKP
ncbi:MAG: adenylyl-sulfate kinase [Nitrospirae bacterium]|nr:adenylyl-sulfate kinase [Nitrospirota bacterium]